MSRGSLIRTASALLLAIALHASYSVPLAAAAELGAILCCAVHCKHSPSPANTSRCCRLEGNTETAAFPSASQQQLPRVTVVAAALPGPLSPRNFEGVASRPSVFERPAPVFLLTRSLRL